MTDEHKILIEYVFEGVLSKEADRRISWEKMDKVCCQQAVEKVVGHRHSWQSHQILPYNNRHFFSEAPTFYQRKYTFV